MVPLEIVLVALVGLGVLFAFGIPVGIALSLAGIGGIWAMRGSFYAASSSITGVAYDVTTNFTLLVIPMFILMGILANYSNITVELFDAAYKWVGRAPGGLAIATNFACAAFAAVTGSSISETVAMAKIAYPEMKKFGYDPGLAAGVIATGGAFAMMIPPSIMLVVYAVFAEQSVGKLLMAGVFPGLVTAIVFAVQILIRAGLKPSLGPAGPSFPLKAKLISLSKIVPFVVVLGSIMGGILFGIWTPSEGAAIGVIIVLIIGLVLRRTKWGAVLAGLRETTVTTAAVFIIIFGAILFGKFLALTGVTDMVTETIISWQLPSFALYLVFVVLYLVLGCFLEGMGMMALTLPLVLPIILEMGWNPIWFGIVLVLEIEIAAVTPPVGMNLFAFQSAVPEIPLMKVIMGCIPFWLCEVGVLILLYFVPQIALWLPSVMKI